MLNATSLLMWLEMVTFLILGAWLIYPTVRFRKIEPRRMDPMRFNIGLFCFLLVYRDWRIKFVDDALEAKLFMCFMGLIIAVVTIIGARSYGRGDRI